jgi:hypothetical protein
MTMRPRVSASPFVAHPQAVCSRPVTRGYFQRDYEKSVRSDHILQERTLGVWSGIFLIGVCLWLLGHADLTVNKIVGAGIFSTPGNIYRNAGSVGLAMFIWVIAGIIATCGAFALLELGTGIPRSGGLKLYLERAYTPKLAATCIYAFCKLIRGRMHAVH